MNKCRGFSLVEVVLAGALFGLIATGFIGALISGQQTNLAAAHKIHAVLLGQEGLEAVRSIRDADWPSLSDGAYGLSAVNGNWELAGTPETIGIFTRTISISAVDEHTKQIISTVAWNQSEEQTASVAIRLYLTDWQSVITRAP